MFVRLACDLAALASAAALWALSRDGERPYLEWAAPAAAFAGTAGTICLVRDLAQILPFLITVAS